MNIRSIMFSLPPFFRQHLLWFVFATSLLLSMLSQWGSELNRDGMLYVTAAEAFLRGSYAEARALFSWPFLPLLMAVATKITGVPLAQAAHTLNALFMAGACVFLVASARHLHKESAIWVALAVLSIPGINEYRHELLREFGYWFFVLFAFWLALRWNDRPTDHRQGR